MRENRLSIKKNLEWLLPLLVLVACLAVSIGVYWVRGETNLDADISSEMTLAKLMNDEGVLITTNWFYSSEVRVISPVLVYQAMLHVFPGNWHAARTVSLLILLCVMAASMVFMTRRLGVSWAASLLSAAAVVLPLTEYQSFMLIYGGFYTVCVALTFTEIGLLLGMEKKRALEPILLLVLGFAGGLNGVRMLMICVAPLLAACFVNFYLEARKCESAAELVRVPSFALLAGGLLLAAATFAGNLVNVQVLAEKYTFQLHTDEMLAPLMSEMFTDQLMSIMAFFGYRGNVQLLSLEGVVSVMAAMLPLLGAGAMVLLLRGKLTQKQRLVAIYMPIALLLGMLINVLTRCEKGVDPFPYIVSYYMPAALLLVFALFWALDRLTKENRLLRVLPMLGLVAVFLAANAVYRERDLEKPQTVEHQRVIEILEEEDAVQGYATFWNANVLTELSGGRIEAWTVENMEDLEVVDWLQRQDHMTRVPEGRMFAIFDPEDIENDTPGLHMDYIVYSSEEMTVCVYDSMEEFEEVRGMYE